MSSNLDRINRKAARKVRDQGIVANIAAAIAELEADKKLNAELDEVIDPRPGMNTKKIKTMHQQDIDRVTAINAAAKKEQDEMYMALAPPPSYVPTFKDPAPPPALTGLKVYRQDASGIWVHDESFITTAVPAGTPLSAYAAGLPRVTARPLDPSQYPF